MMDNNEFNENQERKELLSTREADFVELAQKRKIREMTRGEEIVDFFSRNKWFIVLFGFFGVVTITLIVSFFTTARPDLTVVLFTDTRTENQLAYSREDLNRFSVVIDDILTPQIIDINGDKKISVEVYVFQIDDSLANKSDYQSFQTTLPSAGFIFSDKNSFKTFFLQDENANFGNYFINLAAMYPGNENIIDLYFGNSGENGNQLFAIPLTASENPAVKNALDSLFGDE